MRSADRDRDAGIDALYRLMHRELRRLAIVLVDDAALAEDLVHDAFLGLYRRWASLDTRAAAPAYLRRSVINSCNSELRRRLVRRRRPEPLPLDTIGSPEDRIMLSAEHHQVLRALRQLTGRQREVVVLRYWQGLTETEIADALQISTGSVKSAASRGLARMEAQLRKEQT